MFSRKITFLFIAFIAITAFLFTNKKVTTKEPIVVKEYAYLAPYVKRNKKWQDNDYVSFIEHMNDKHLVILAVGCNVKNINKEEFNSDEEVIDFFGGRKELETAIKKDFIWDANSATTAIFRELAHYHEWVMWVAKKRDIDVDYDKLSTFEFEKEILNALFVTGWNKLTEEQREEVIKKTGLDTKLTNEQKLAIIAGSGTVALTVLSTTVMVTGFAFYTGMSSMIAASFAVIGVTAPFAVYAGASTTVGVMSGPVGWACICIGAGATAIWATGANVNKTFQNLISLHSFKIMALNDAGLLEEQTGPRLKHDSSQKE